MKSIELDCEIIIDRHYAEIENVNGFKSREISRVEYRAIIKPGKEHLLIHFNDRFKAKLLIELPERKIEVSKTSLDLALEHAISNGAQTGKDFKEMVSKIIGFEVNDMGLKFVTARDLAILEYCEKHLDQMWAAVIVGIILNCDFRDSHIKLKKYKELNGL